MRVLGLINARGGSKGIPRKNIKLLNNKPLIAWTISAALKSKNLSKVIVSTDDEEIAEISKKHGAEVPFIRPDFLATDKSLQIDCIKHAVAFLEENEEFYDYIMVLQPTVPLRNSDDIDAAINVAKNTQVDSVISVCDVGGKHPLTYYEKISNLSIKPIISSNKKGVLRQDFKEVYWRNGAIYLIQRDTLIKKNSLYGDTIGYCEMPEERSFNVDSLFDWNVLESFVGSLK